MLPESSLLVLNHCQHAIIQDSWNRASFTCELRDCVLLFDFKEEARHRRFDSGDDVDECRAIDGETKTEDE